MEKQFPSFLQMMTNYVKSSAKHIANNLKVTTEEQYRNRLQACHSCPNLSKEKRCTLCGCYVESKAYRVSDYCPDNPPRWEKLTIGEDGVPVSIKSTDNAKGEDNNTEASDKA